VVGLAAPGAPETVDKRFLASATAPDAAGLWTGADLLAGVPVLPVVLAVVLGAAGLADDFGLVGVADVVGFRVVVEAAVFPRFSARVSVFPGGWWAPEGASDVRLVAEVEGFFFSSPEPLTEAWGLWATLEDVGPVT